MVPETFDTCFKVTQSVISSIIYDILTFEIDNCYNLSEESHLFIELKAVTKAAIPDKE